MLYLPRNAAQRHVFAADHDVLAACLLRSGSAARNDLAAAPAGAGVCFTSLTPSPRLPLHLIGQEKASSQTCSNSLASRESPKALRVLAGKLQLFIACRIW